MTPTQRDARALLYVDGGLDAVPELHRRWLLLVQDRPTATVIRPVPGDVDQTYRELVGRL